MIYFITARAIGRVKIGRAKNPQRRFINLQVGSPVALALERVCAGNETEEARLHARFSEHRISGEWFALAPEIETHMERLEKPVAKTRGPKTSGHIIDDLGGNTALAKALNLTPNAISNWRSRGIPWKLRPTIARMAAEKAVPLPGDFWGEAA